MEKAALLVIDAQNEMFDEANPIYKGKELLENLQLLIEKARSSDVPVIFVQYNDETLVNGTHDWEIYPSIGPYGMNEKGDS